MNYKGSLVGFLNGFNDAVRSLACISMHVSVGRLRVLIPLEGCET